MEKILLDWKIKRVKLNARTWKDKLYYEATMNHNNYWISVVIYTKGYWYLHFQINNNDIINLISQKEIEFKIRQEENNKLINNFLLDFNNN